MTQSILTNEAKIQEIKNVDFSSLKMVRFSSNAGAVSFTREAPTRYRPVFDRICEGYKPLYITVGFSTADNKFFCVVSDSDSLREIYYYINERLDGIVLNLKEFLMTFDQKHSLEEVAI
jgi:hypothetical protein